MTVSWTDEEGNQHQRTINTLDFANVGEMVSSLDPQPKEWDIVVPRRGFSTAQMRVLKEARLYLSDIVDCTCDREFGNCFYYLPDVGKAKEAVAWAIRRLEKEGENAEIPTSNPDV